MPCYSAADYYPDPYSGNPPYRPHRYVIDVDGKKRQVIITERPSHYMPDALGMTDGISRVVVHTDLPYNVWKDLLYHEFRHIKNRARDRLLSRQKRERIVRRECNDAGKDRYLAAYAVI